MALCVLYSGATAKVERQVSDFLNFPLLRGGAAPCAVIAGFHGI
jgi:hypothetical protein